MVDSEFLNARKKAVTTSIRMDERAGLLSEAHYFWERMSKAKRKQAKEAGELHQSDRRALERFVEWGLAHEKKKMLQWASTAAEMTLSAAYQKGWQQTLAQWQGQGQDVEAPPALSWLITMWHRALVESAEQPAPVRFPR